MTAFIGGEPADLDEAVERAAAILGRARLPVVAGLGTDMAGARAAIRLARRLRGVVDHMASEALLRYVRVVQDAGIMFTTPAEMRRRCDLLVAVGLVPRLERLVGVKITARPDLIGLGAEWRAGAAQGRDVSGDSSRLVAEIRARLNGRPIRGDAAGIDRLVDRLRSARFGVFAFDPAHLDVLTLEALCGLARELNAATRFSLLRLPDEDNADGVNEAALWLTGGPVRVGFGRGHPEHDPWRFEAARLVDSGEADAALWISALGRAAPGWRRSVPLVALTADGLEVPAEADVRIDVGRPGVDHDAVLMRPETGALGAIAAAAPSNRPAVSDILERIAARLPPC